MQTNPYQSAKLRDKKRKQKRLKNILIISVAVFIFSLVVYLLNASFLSIQQIIVDDVEYSNRNDIELAIKEKIEGRYLGMFSRSNALIFSRTKIARDIKSKFPSIKEVDVDLKGFTTINVQLEEYASTALWCDVPVTPASTLTHDVNEDGEDVEKISVIPQVVSSFSSSNCFFVNDEGVIFSPAKFDSNNDVLKTFGKITSDPVRQSYADKKTFQELIEFSKLLRRLNIVADEIWTTNGEVYAFVTKEKVKIYIDSQTDIGKLFDNLETVIKRDAINKAQFSNIDYIDLRFGNRVFYKLK
jgi:cell division septal protein FtsQ